MLALRKPYIWEFQKRKIGSTALTRTSDNRLQKTPQKRRGGGEGGAVHIDEEFARTLFKSAPKQHISNKRKSWAHNLR